MIWFCQVWIVDIVAQQYDRPEADPPRLAGGSRSADEKQAPGSGSAVRPSGRRKEAQEDVDRSAGEAIARGLFRRPAAPLGRENRRHCRETRPQKERRPRLVLQPAPEAEAHEIRRSTILLNTIIHKTFLKTKKLWFNFEIN